VQYFIVLKLLRL